MPLCSRSLTTSFDPMKPLPPITTIFIIVPPFLIRQPPSTINDDDWRQENSSIWKCSDFHQRYRVFTRNDVDRYPKATPAAVVRIQTPSSPSRSKRRAI